MRLEKKLEEKLIVIGVWFDVKGKDGYDKDDISFLVWVFLIETGKFWRVGDKNEKL